MNKSDFTELVMPFKDRLFRLARRILVSDDEAEDAVQEVLYKLWRDRDKIANYRSPEAFAITMTKNYCLDRLKSKQAGNLKLVHSNYADESVSLQGSIETRDSLGWMSKIISKLPEQQRMVLQLRDIEQYEFNEIEEMLSMKATAVRVTLSRARKAVRDELTKTHSYGISK